MSVRYLKNVGICACEDRNIWTRAATGDAEWWTLAKNLACFFYFLRKRVAGWRSETDVSVVGCLIKVSTMHVSGRIMITQQANYLIIFVTLAVFSSLILLIKFFKSIELVTFIYR